MNKFRTLCLIACLVALGSAYRSNSISNKFKPSEWLSLSELESIPAVDEVTFKQLESLSVQEGADLVNQLYHLSQIKQNIEPSYAPSPSDIPAYVFTPTGQKVKVSLNELVDKVKQQPESCQKEATIFITGLPSELNAVSKANRKLVQAYLQLYNGNVQPQDQQDYDYGGWNSKNQQPTSSEETHNVAQQQSAQSPRGCLLVIDLGETIRNFKQLTTLDVHKTGKSVGNVLANLCEEANISPKDMYIVAQGVGAHVAGGAARQCYRKTDKQIRRISALDPSKIYAHLPNTLMGLARGNADFVDAIHTSAYGLGTLARVGCADFFPNGPSVAVPGANNIIEASMRATRYFAESLRPGNERNFPAVAAESLQDYKSNNGYGRRTYMGIDTDFDVEGDFILQVNPQSPFGKGAPAQKQNSFHSGVQQHSPNKWQA